MLPLRVAPKPFVVEGATIVVPEVMKPVYIDTVYVPAVLGAVQIVATPVAVVMLAVQVDLRSLA